MDRARSTKSDVLTAETGLESLARAAQEVPHHVGRINLWAYRSFCIPFFGIPTSRVGALCLHVLTTSFVAQTSTEICWFRHLPRS